MSRQDTVLVGAGLTTIIEAMGNSWWVRRHRVGTLLPPRAARASLLHPGDADGLRAAIRQVLGVPVRAQALGERARERVAKAAGTTPSWLQLRRSFSHGRRRLGNSRFLATSQRQDRLRGNSHYSVQGRSRTACGRPGNSGRSLDRVTT